MGFADGLMKGYGFVEDIERNRNRDKLYKEDHDQRQKIGEYSIGDLERRKQDADQREAIRQAGMMGQQQGDGQMPPVPQGLTKVAQPGDGQMPPLPAPEQSGVEVTPVRMPGQPEQGMAAAPASLGPKPIKSMEDPTDTVIESALKSQKKAMEMGRPDLAFEYWQKTLPLRDGVRMKAFDSARAKYIATQDPNALVPAFNKYLNNGLSIDKITPMAGSQGDDPKFMIAGTTDDGKPYQREIGKKQLEDMVSMSRDPKAFHASEAEYAKRLHESGLKVIEAQAGKGPFTASTEQNVWGPDGRLIQRGAPKNEFKSVTVKGDDGVERALVFDPRTGQYGDGGAGGQGDNSSSRTPPKYVQDFGKQVDSAVLALFKVPDMTQMAPEIRAKATSMTNIASSLGAANYGTDNRSVLTAGKALDIANGVIEGKLKVVADPAGRFVEFEGRKYLIDPREAPKPQSSAGLAPSPRTGVLAPLSAPPDFGEKFRSFKSPEWDTVDQAAAKKAGIDPAMLKNIRTRGEKSNGDQVGAFPNGKSSGAKTVYQITEETRNLFYRKYGIDAYESPENAATIAALHLKESLDRHKAKSDKDAESAAYREYFGGPDPRMHGAQTKAYEKRAMGLEPTGKAAISSNGKVAVGQVGIAPRVN